MPSPVVFNAETEAQGVFVNVVTFAHTTAGVNRKLHVTINWSLVPGLTFTSVTYAGVAMTNIGGTITAGNGVKSRVYELVGPALGANNVVVTTVGGSGDILACYATSFKDCKQSLSTNFTTNVGGNPITTNVTTTVDNSLCLYTGVGGDTAGTNSIKEFTSGQAQSGCVYVSAAVTPPGSFSMTISNASNNAMFMIVIEPLDPPVILTVSPNSGTTLGGTSVAITGTGFAGGDSFEFEGVPATSVVIVDPNNATCVTPSVLGETRLVDVTLNGAGTLANGYTYVKPTPTLTPRIAIRGYTIDIDVLSAGDVFTIGTTASFSGTGLQVNSTTRHSDTHLTINATIAGNATGGLRDLILTVP